MVNIAIVDDDAECRGQLRRYVEDFFAGNGDGCRVREYRDGIDLVSPYNANHNIIFLDIEMNVLDGMDTAQKIREKDENVILFFVTRMAQYAVDGYLVGAMGFIVKPVDRFSLEIQLRRAVKQLSLARQSSIVITENYNKRVISSEKLLYVEVVGHDRIFHTVDGDYSDHGTIKACIQELGDRLFAMPHQSYLINMQHISEVRKDEVVLKDTVIPISRKQKKRFMEQLNRYYSG